MRIFLCRHGETVLNAEKKWQGRCDSPLTPKGLLHSRNIAGYLTHKKIDAIFVSSLGRAKETAALLRKRFPKAEYFELDALKEIDNGEADGLTIEETRRRYPHLINRINLEDLHSAFPDGESYDAVTERLLPFVELLKKDYSGKTVAIVAHGGVNRMLLRILFGLSDEETTKVSIPNEAIYEIDLSKEGRKIFNIMSGKKSKGFILKKNKPE